MKRGAVFGAVLLVLAALTACLPAATPPPGYLRPVVESISTPDPVGPGEPVSIALQVRDDERITGLQILSLKTGDGRTYPSTPPCNWTMASGADVAHATLTVTCAVPTFANSGVWDVVVNVRDSTTTTGIPGVNVHLPFQVVGGSDDIRAPHLDSWSTDPAQLRTSSAFTFTARFSDPAGIVWIKSIFITKDVPFTYATMSCRDPQRVEISPTDVQVTWACQATAGKTEVGLYRFEIEVRDGLGHMGTARGTGIPVTT